MGRFHNAHEAKDFLVSRIVAETKRQQIALSEIERKMLYFSETHWTLPDMSNVSDEFDRQYDQDEYEGRITLLIWNAARHDEKESRDQYRAWWDAIRLLAREDHYILVMIRAAGLRPPGDQLKLFIAGLLIAIIFVVAVLLNAFVFQRHGFNLGKYMPSDEVSAFYIWVLAAAVACGYLLLQFTIGTKKTERIFAKIIGKLLPVRRL